MSLRVTFWASDKPRERLLADAFLQGAAAAGDFVEMRTLQPTVEVAECDVACMVGVKSRELFNAHWDRGIHTLMLDKGYTRHAAPGPVKLWEYWRVAVDAHHPTEKLMRIARPHDRWEHLGLVFKPWQEPDPSKAVLIAGSSAKYHDFYGLWEPTRWTQKLVREIRKVSSQPIIYRPKPSWREAVPIEGTLWSGSEETIDQVLKRTAVLVTHGSNACFEAQLASVPCIILGNGVAKPISATSIEEFNSRRRPVSAEERLQWAANLAYCQWTLAEFAEGGAWEIIRPQIFG